MNGPLLALDLASRTGWAAGRAGDRQRSGVVVLGGTGAAHGERFAALFRWLWDFISVEKPARIVFEAPMTPSHMRGATNVDTATLLIGLPAVVQTVAQLRGVWAVSKANVQDVRQHFIAGRPFTWRGKPLVGRRNLRSAEAKFCVGERCRELGYAPADDNEADAIALAHYCHALTAPAVGARETPLMEAAR